MRRLTTVAALLGLLAGGSHAAENAPDARSVWTAAWTTVCVIPWGAGDGKLKEEIRSTDERQAYRGPTRILALDGGKLAILDTLGSAVKEFDESGKMLRALPYPENDSRDAETLCIDMGSPRPGEYRVLSLGQQAVLTLSQKGEPVAHTISGTHKDSLLWAMVCDAAGASYVLDANDNTLLRMDAAGRPLPAFKHDLAAALVLDTSGRFYNMRLASKSSARAYELVRWTPGSEPVVLGRVTSRQEINRVDVFGTDAAGNIYAFLGMGAIENPSRLIVARFDATGKQTGQAPAPPDPIELKFQHAKAVSPDGTVYAVAVAPNGLALMKLRAFGD
ncbi:MAG: hypothetical protein HYY25_04380 [Candidatus Wallbacteria bacterium]|nr:hypothetical protein [Candidatus Wallbacteria bacterium]